MKQILLFFLVLFSKAIADTALYLINIDSGKALSFDGTSIKFADKTFGEKSQLWKFSSNGTLVVLHNDEYLGYNHQTSFLEMKKIDDVAWYWEDMKLVLQDQSPLQKLCVSDSGEKAVKCNQTEAAKISLHIYDGNVHDLVKDIDFLINSTSANLISNLTSLEQSSNSTKSELSTTQIKIDTWNTTLANEAEVFEIDSLKISDNITLTKGHLDDELNKLEDSMTSLIASLEKISSHMNDTHFNFTDLESSLATYRDTTKDTLTSRLSDLSDILSEKSTNGHVTPDNVYEFADIFLLALGIVNIIDIARRLIKYSVQGVAERMAPKYGVD